MAAKKPPMKELGERMKAARERAALSQADLARMSGVSNKTIGTLEKGLHEEVRPQPILRIAAALGEDADPWLALAGHDGLHPEAVKRALAPGVAGTPDRLALDRLRVRPEEWEAEVLERLEDRPGILAVCYSSPPTGAERQITAEQLVGLVRGGLWVAIVFAHPLPTDPMPESSADLWLAYRHGHDRVRAMVGDLRRRVGPKDAERVALFAPRPRDPLFLTPPFLVLDVRPMIVKFLGDDVWDARSYYCSEWVRSPVDGSRELLCMHCRSDAPAADVTVQVAAWREYLGDILLPWDASGGTSWPHLPDTSHWIRIDLP